MNDAVDRARKAHDEARRMYQRVLARWAMDVMSLRRAGLDSPCLRVEGPGVRVRRAA